MTLDVLLPDDNARSLLGPVPAGVTLRCWDGGGPLPEGAAETRFWVPRPAAGFDVPSAVAALPRLEVVQLLSAGADAFVGALPDGVLLCDARGVHTTSVAEWACAVLLASVRELPTFVRAQAERRWANSWTDELAGKRVLLVGAGAIGAGLRARLEPFEVQVISVARRAREGVHGVDELPALLPDADVVVVLLPLTSATRGLVDARFLAAMPDGALLVNGGRGPLVDTDALTAELRAGRLRAALDVTDPEPLPSDHPLWTMDGLPLTPHVGGAVKGFPRRAYALVREQLERHLAGEPLHNVVADGY